MRALSLLLCLLLAGPVAAQDESDAPGCKEDRITCREDCSIEFGSSTRNLKKLGSCIGTCNYRYDKCRRDYLTLQKQKQLGIEPSPAPTTPVPPEEPDSSATAEGSPEDSTDPSSSSEPDEPPVRRGVYRASEVAAPEPAQGSEPEPPAKAEPEPAATAATEEEIPIFGDPPPPPKPKQRPASTRPQPLREPEKDISDWDPEGK